MNLFFASNIGIIGGADGPTAVFVSGSLLCLVLGWRGNCSCGNRQLICLLV